MPDGNAASAHLSIRLPAEIVESLDKIAAAVERPRSWVVLRALKLYLADEGGEVLETAAGMASIARGEGVDFDAAMAELRATAARRGKKRTPR
jgi:predicted transcriptional regulator